MKPEDLFPPRQAQPAIAINKADEELARRKLEAEAKVIADAMGFPYINRDRGDEDGS